MKRILAALALLGLAFVATANAQLVPFPQSLPANTVVGRLGVSAGPAQAVPFAVLTSNLLSTLTQADPTTICPLSSFYAPTPDQGNKGVLCAQSTWDGANSGLNGGAIIANTIINAGAGNVGSPTAFIGGTLVNADISGLDPAGAAFQINNNTVVTSPLGTAIYALVRGDKASNADLSMGPDAIRAVSEVTAGQHPRVGLVVFNSNATNQFKRGLWVTEAVDYGVLVGNDIAPPAITPTTPIAALVNSVGVTSHDGVLLSNPTAAAAGAQQWSPRLRLTGQGWKTNATAASQTVDWYIENQPQQGTANPSTWLVLTRTINGALAIGGTWVATGGGAALVVGPTAPIAGLADGDLQVARNATTGAIFFGSNGSNFLFFDGTKYQFNGGPLTVAGGGTGLGSGTSGGIPYFSGSTTIASSTALAANAIVVGGGAGVAPLTQPTTPPTVSSTGVVSVVNATASTSSATGSLIVSGGAGVVGAIYSGAEVATGAAAVAGLPTCNAAHKAARHFVTDANATFTAGIGAVVAGGGANNVPVTCDGTNWRIG